MEDVPRPIFIKHNDIPHDVLTRNQVRVINVIIGRSRCNSSEAASSIDEKLGVGASQILAEYCRSRLMTINFHGTLFEKFRSSEHYKSLYEVRASNKTRDSAEDRVFLDLYKDAHNIERPKYGSLDIHNMPGVDAGVYGLCYLVLKESVRKRVTVTDRDSFGIVEVGVCDWMLHVVGKLTTSELEAIYNIATGKTTTTGVLFAYMEIQIHGLLRFAHDIAEVHVPNRLGSKLINEGRKFAEQFDIKFVID